MVVEVAEVVVVEEEVVCMKPLALLRMIVACADCPYLPC